jgi:MFS family permease
MLLSAVSGRISDAGYFRVVFLVGVFFQVLAIFMASLCTQYWQLMLTQGVLTGIGAGLLCCPIMSVSGTYFLKRRGIAFGIMTCGNVTGGLVFPAMARQLLPSVGFGWTMRAIGFVQMACLLAVSAVIRARVKPNVSGPILDVKVFKELDYTFYCAAMFFVGSILLCCPSCTVGNLTNS